MTISTLAEVSDTRPATRTRNSSPMLTSSTGTGLVRRNASGTANRMLNQSRASPKYPGPVMNPTRTNPSAMAMSPGQTVDPNHRWMLCRMPRP